MLNAMVNTRLGLPVMAVLLATSVGAVASGEHGGDHGRGDGAQRVSVGEPASADEATRIIRIKAKDSMQFNPSNLNIEPGETVRFVVENVGRIQHSFTLGTLRQQEQHAQEMKGMMSERMAGHMKDDPSGVVVQPGKTEALTWQFPQGGSIEFACHIPGHYPAGMKGSISLS